MSRESRLCATCGRSFAWRKKWRRDWPQVRYCSERCRRQRPTRLDRSLEEAIQALLDERAADASICPSEAARKVGGESWRPLMEPVRRAANRLASRGLVEITQRGHSVDPASARGPIRLRRPRRSRPQEWERRANRSPTDAP